MRTVHGWPPDEPQEGAHNTGNQPNRQPHTEEVSRRMRNLGLCLLSHSWSLFPGVSSMRQSFLPDKKAHVIWPECGSAPELLAPGAGCLFMQQLVSLLCSLDAPQSHWTSTTCTERPLDGQGETTGHMTLVSTLESSFFKLESFKLHFSECGALQMSPSKVITHGPWHQCLKSTLYFLNDELWVVLLSSPFLLLSSVKPVVIL